jgi:hypothetical protein
VNNFPGSCIKSVHQGRIFGVRKPCLRFETRSRASGHKRAKLGFARRKRERGSRTPNGRCTNPGHEPNPFPCAQKSRRVIRSTCAARAVGLPIREGPNSASTVVHPLRTAVRTASTRISRAPNSVGSAGLRSRLKSKIQSLNQAALSTQHPLASVVSSL